MARRRREEEKRRRGRRRRRRRVKSGRKEWLEAVEGWRKEGPLGSPP